MATFQDPYDNSDYIASLVSGQVSGGFLVNEQDTLGWDATSTDLGAEFSASAITGVFYSPEKSGGTDSRLQFSSDGSTWTNKDGTVQPSVGYYKFDGIDDYIDCGSGATLDDLAQSALAFTAWVRPRSGDGRIIDKAISSYTTGWFCHMYTSSGGYCRIMFYVYCSGTDLNVYTTSYIVKEDEWAHIAVSWDGSLTTSPTLLYNGRLITTFTKTNGTGTATSDAGDNFLIGNRAAYDKSFDGDISEVIVWNSAKTETELRNAFLYGAVPAGYVGRWSLDGNANDSSGNSNNGTASGAVNYTDPERPAVGQLVGDPTSRFFDGSTDYFDLGTNFGSLAQTSFTISCWINAKGGTGSRDILFGNYDGNPSVNFEIQTGDQLRLYINGLSFTASGFAVRTGEWVHCVVTRTLNTPTNDTIRIYKNGVEVFTYTYTTTLFSVTNNTYIGMDGRASTHRFHGFMANLAVWNEARTGAEILAEYEDGQVDVTHSDLRAFFPLNGSGLNALDAGPNSYDGSAPNTGSTPLATTSSRRPTYSSGQTEIDISALSLVANFYYKLLSEISINFGSRLSEFTVSYTAGSPPPSGGGGANTNLIVAGDTLVSNVAFSTASGNAVIIDSRNKLNVKILGMNSAFECNLRKDTSGGDLISYVPAGSTKLRASISVPNGTNVYLDGGSNTTLTYSWTPAR